MFRELLRDSIMEGIISFLDVAIGIFLLAYGWSIRRQINSKMELFYFGLVALIIGIWSLNETDFSVLLLQNRVASSFLAYVCLMLVVPTYVLFNKYSLKVKNTWLPNLICIASYCNLFICTILELTGIRSFRENLMIIFSFIGIALLYAIGSIISMARQFRLNQKVLINITGSILLTITFILDVLVYINTQIAGVFTKIGVLVYLGLLGYEVLTDTMKYLKEGHKAEIYRKFAITDMLTGLLNRNAYNEWAEQQDNPKDIMLVTFDLNNLKHCNDTLGHTMGDHYIQSAANIILKSFDTIGTCYRIGGDKFCVVIEAASYGDIESRLQQLENMEEEYNETSKLGFRMEIAYGAATFDEEKDHTMEDTRNRADVMMYEHKRKLKAV